MARVVKLNFLCATINIGQVLGKNHCNVTKMWEENQTTLSINQENVVSQGYSVVTLSSVERVEDDSKTLGAALKVIPLCRQYDLTSENHLIYLLIENAYQNHLHEGLLDEWMNETLTSLEATSEFRRLPSSSLVI